MSEEKSLLTKIVKNTQGNSVQWGKEHPQYLGTIMFVFLCIFLLILFQARKHDLCRLTQQEE